MALNNLKFLFLLIFLFIILSVLQIGRDRTEDISEWNKDNSEKKDRIIQYIQLIIILLFSYFCILDWRFAVCVFAETIISYVAALLVDKTDDDKDRQKRRKIIAGGGGYSYPRSHAGIL